MQKYCTNCGKPISDNEGYCAACGATIPDDMPNVANSDFSQSSDTNSSTQNYNQQPSGQYIYTNPYTEPHSEEMSLGKWVGTIIVTTFFGLISLVLLFIWGFGEGPESRKRYCKAMLIVQAISIGVAILLMLLIFLPLGGLVVSSFKDGFDRGWNGERIPWDDNYSYYSEEHSVPDIGSILEQYGISTDKNKTLTEV